MDTTEAAANVSPCERVVARAPSPKSERELVERSERCCNATGSASLLNCFPNSIGETGNKTLLLAGIVEHQGHGFVTVACDLLLAWAVSVASVINDAALLSARVDILKTPSVDATSTPRAVAVLCVASQGIRRCCLCAPDLSIARATLGAESHAPLCRPSLSRALRRPSLSRAYVDSSRRMQRVGRRGFSRPSSHLISLASFVLLPAGAGADA
jgi:hypothetical protein